LVNFLKEYVFVNSALKIQRHVVTMHTQTTDYFFGDFAHWVALSFTHLDFISTFSSKQTIFPMNAAKFNKPLHHVQKFLFSATLTENPEKIASLELFNPLLFLSRSSSAKCSSAENVEEEEQGIPFIFSH